mmetsp:Transcript_528/g.1908  ORF Transcript_528/g.1908 Transcript_528/m.1908 type:complete len:326 (-) Transcript_528:432-1409(-)
MRRVAFVDEDLAPAEGLDGQEVQPQGVQEHLFGHSPLAAHVHEGPPGHVVVDQQHRPVDQLLGVLVLDHGEVVPAGEAGRRGDAEAALVRALHAGRAEAELGKGGRAGARAAGRPAGVAAVLAPLYHLRHGLDHVVARALEVPDVLAAELVDVADLPKPHVGAHAAGAEGCLGGHAQQGRRVRRAPPAEAVAEGRAARRRLDQVFLLAGHAEEVVQVGGEIHRQLLVLAGDEEVLLAQLHELAGRRGRQPGEARRRRGELLDVLQGDGEVEGVQHHAVEEVEILDAGLRRVLQKVLSQIQLRQLRRDGGVRTLAPLLAKAEGLRR